VTGVAGASVLALLAWMLGGTASAGRAGPTIVRKAVAAGSSDSRTFMLDLGVGTINVEVDTGSSECCSLGFEIIGVTDEHGAGIGGRGVATYGIDGRWGWHTTPLGGVDGLAGGVELLIGGVVDEGRAGGAAGGGGDVGFVENNGGVCGRPA
jgi:hypothetical protein